MHIKDKNIITRYVNHPYFVQDCKTTLGLTQAGFQPTNDRSLGNKHNLYYLQGPKRNEAVCVDMVRVF